jgi:hypothetical protein
MLFGGEHGNTTVKEFAPEDAPLGREFSLFKS